MAEPTSTLPDKKHRVGDSLSKWGALTVGSVGGVVGVVITIWEKFEASWKQIPEYQTIFDQRAAEWKTIREKPDLGFWDKLKQSRAAGNAAYGEFYREIKKDYDIVTPNWHKANLANWQKPLHYGADFVKGTGQRLLYNGRWERGSTLFNGAAGAVVTVGAIWALKEHQNLRSQLDESEAKNAAHGR